MVKDARSTVVPKETANKKILILSAAKKIMLTFWNKVTKLMSAKFRYHHKGSIEQQGDFEYFGKKFSDANVFICKCFFQFLN